MTVSVVSENYLHHTDMFLCTLARQPLLRDGRTGLSRRGSEALACVILICMEPVEAREPSLTLTCSACGDPDLDMARLF